MAIILVVLHHTIRWLLKEDLAPEYWSQITEFLRTLRMPLFFGIAGVFGASWIYAKSWRDLLSKKVLVLGWVYLLWCAIRWLFFLFAPRLGPEEPFYLSRLLAAPFWPTNELWFLFALCFFFVVAKALRTVPVWLHLCLAGGVSVFAFSDLVDWPTEAYQGMASYYLFFLIGACFRGGILAKIPRIGPLSAVCIVACWAGAYIGARLAGIYDIGLVQVIVRVLGAVSGLLIARVLAETLIFRGWLSWVGRNTMPIYVAHVLWIIPIVAFVSVGDRAVSPGLAAVLPVLICAAATSLGLLVWAASNRLHLQLYAPPARLAKALAGKQPAVEASSENIDTTRGVDTTR
ncbi:hypothetical protein GS492_15320 [Rhodococcus hoagii]|nr:hypothetical protein [Prescottella equi]